MLQEHGFCFPSLFRLVGHRGEQQSPAPLRFLFLLPVVTPLSWVSPLPKLPGSGAVVWGKSDVLSSLSLPAHLHHRVPVATQPGKVVLAQTQGPVLSVLRRPRQMTLPRSPVAVAANAPGDRRTPCGSGGKVSGGGGIAGRPGGTQSLGVHSRTVQCASVSACEGRLEMQIIHRPPSQFCQNIVTEDFTQMVAWSPHPHQRQWIYEGFCFFILFYFQNFQK